MELSNTHRLLSAGLGACLTSLVVTPFDVVKTRLQAQINSVNGGSGGAGGAAAAAAPRRPTASQELLRNCSHYRLHTGLTDQWCANCFSFSRRQPEPALSWRPQAGRAPPKPEDLRFSGAIDAAMKLVKHEGAASLWRGLSPTLLMSIPSTVVYFSVYDKTKIAMAALTPEYVAKHHAEWLAPHTGTLQTLSPLLSGVFARALTTTLVSPIELVRTKSQSLRTSSTMRALLSEEMQRGGFFSLWRGVGPTLMRDVPFSAIYWTSYEYSKLWMLMRWGVAVDKRAVAVGPGGAPAHAPGERNKMIYASFLAGAGSGMLSAAITHPFDLIKTRRQIELYAHEAAAAAEAAAAESEAATAAANASAGHVHSSSCRHGAAAASFPGNGTAAASSLRPAVASSSSAASAAAATGASESLFAIPTSTWSVMKTIVAEEGYLGLLSGLSARITKIAPACAIMISTYEVAKMYFGDANVAAADHAQRSRRHTEI